LVGSLEDVVVAQGAAVLELLAGEDEALLFRRDALLVLDLLLHVLDGVRRLHVQRDGLARQRLDEEKVARGGTRWEAVPVMMALTMILGCGRSPDARSYRLPIGRPPACV
jgi:hypothetical protein